MMDTGEEGWVSERLGSGLSCSGQDNGEPLDDPNTKNGQAQIISRTGQRRQPPTERLGHVISQACHSPDRGPSQRVVPSPPSSESGKSIPHNQQHIDLIGLDSNHSPSGPQAGGSDSDR